MENKEDKPLCAEILCVGTEILLGNIVNTNSAVLSRGLADCGVALYRHTVVGDNPQRLKDALREAFSRSDVVITTGGLGPTCDDLTKETVAAYFGVPLVVHEPSLAALKERFTRFARPMTQNNLKQAEMPQGAWVLENPNGTAPGAIVTDGSKTAILLPGPPREMEPMFRNHVLPYLQKRSQRVFCSHCVYFFGIGESALEAQLAQEMTAMKNPTLAPYAKDGEVMLRVTASAACAQEAEMRMAPVLQELQERFPQYIYGVDVDDLQTAAVRALRKAGLHVATAESCTGGYLAKRLTEVPGCSDVFHCGVVSYSNEIKENLLGVLHETLQRFGAVSAQTAREMALGARRISGAELGLSVTGEAGPQSSGSQPVGLVYVAVSSPWYSDVLELHLARGNRDGEREVIRLVAASHALRLLLTALGQKP